jgi:UDP-2,3-diacylglucosamine hydrolase
VERRFVSANSKRIGLVAGWGRFPVIVAQALRREGFEVYCLGIKDHADAAALRAVSHHFKEVGIGKLGVSIRYFRKNRVQLATMAGKIFKVKVFEKFALIRHFPDWRFLRTFWPVFITKKMNRRDDTLLLAVIDAFAEDQIRFAPATDFAPELLVKSGQLSGPPLTAAQQKDIEFGWKAAKEMGRLDIGQSVCVKNETVIAVEAIEGTDECIRRAGELCKQGGFVVVKVAKPQQDMRFDVPTVGMGTLERLVASGGKVLAVEAEKTIFVDEAEVRREADRRGITIVAVRGE